jgi:hypothetical protein
VLNPWPLSVVWPGSRGQQRSFGWAPAAAAGPPSHIEFRGPERTAAAPDRGPQELAAQRSVKLSSVYPSALMVGWMKLFLMIWAACDSAVLISGWVTDGR